MNKTLSAKDVAFEKERIKFRSKIHDLEHQVYYWRLEYQKEAIISKHNEEIIGDLESQIVELSNKLDIPKEVLLKDIENNKKLASIMPMLGIAQKSFTIVK